MKLRLAVLGAAVLLVAPALAAPPRPEGRAWFVQNAATGEVLLSHSAADSVPIASITKLMTVLVTLEHTKLDDVVIVSPQAARVGESSIYLRPGETLTVRELVEAALIQSANDAAVALAAYVGHGDLSAFVGLMNAKAQQLGLRDTHFANPDGLDEFGHYSSARDVTKLARVAMHNAFVREVVRETSASISGGRTLHTWNDLLYTFPHLLGVKTGHTSQAGWSEVAAAGARGVTIYATLLGEPSRSQRNSDLAALLAWGIDQYRVVQLIGTSRVYAWAQAPYGRPSVGLVAVRPVIRVVRVNRPLVERVTVPASVTLPVEQGAALGKLEIWSGKKLVATEPLVATRTIRKPGFVAKAEWYAGRAVHKFWSWLT